MSRPDVRTRRDERGAALLVALMAITLVVALGTALLLAAGLESRIARNFASGSQAFYAADAAIERAIDDLRALPDWNAALSGVVTSAFVDGPAGLRTLADGRPIDVGEIVNRATCRQATACADSEMDAFTAERPWGRNNPRWQPFAWGPFTDLVPGGGVDMPFYLVVLVGDDPSENDGNPLADGSKACVPGDAGPCNPGTGRVVLRAEAFGPFAAHVAIEANVARPGAIERQADYSSGVDQAGVRILSWRELR